MMDFETASKAAEDAIGSLVVAYNRADEGWEPVFHYFSVMYRLMFDGFDDGPAIESIQRERETLHLIADSPIDHIGFYCQKSFASAHEAAVEICQEVRWGMMCPLEQIKDADQWKATAQWMVDSRMEHLQGTCRLVSRIQRERAKFKERIRLGLVQKPSSEPQPGGWYAGELAAKLGIDGKTINRWAKDLRIETPKQGGNNYRYPKHDIIHFLEHAATNARKLLTRERAKELLLNVRETDIKTDIK
jgi:hypothetical protein